MFADSYVGYYGVSYIILQTSSDQYISPQLIFTILKLFTLFTLTIML